VVPKELIEVGDPRGTTTLLSIGVVAGHVGVHPQTLREYERQGLVTPQRTAGGTRRYGPAELARLEAIQRLTAEGMSLAAVRYVLELEDQLRAAEARNAEHEAQLTRAGMHVERQKPARRGQGSGANAVVTRSISVELVHVPRTPRSPRWRNEEH
jgi:MerR family transcriptional regulator/heat shock protein HspR